MHRLVQALREDRKPDRDVYDIVTGSAIVPITEVAVAKRSRPVDFPDFTQGNCRGTPRIYAGIFFQFPA